MVAVHCERHGDRWLCEVGVHHTGRRTKHSVTVTRADLERWGGGPEQSDAEKLVARSFEFLLQREPPGSILARFDPSVIRDYFPEYDEEFSRRT